MRSDHLEELSELRLRTCFEVIRKEEGLLKPKQSNRYDKAGDKPLRTSYMGAEL